MRLEIGKKEKIQCVGLERVRAEPASIVMHENLEDNKQDNIRI